MWKNSKPCSHIGRQCEFQATAPASKGEGRRRGRPDPPAGRERKGLRHDDGYDRDVLSANGPVAGYRERVRSPGRRKERHAGEPDQIRGAVRADSLCLVHHYAGAPGRTGRSQDVDGGRPGRKGPVRGRFTGSRPGTQRGGGHGRRDPHRTPPPSGSRPVGRRTGRGLLRAIAPVQ